MPDYTYHPFFKTILFRLPAEDARRLTLGLLALQARTRLGRRVFRVFGHGVPSGRDAVTAFGVRFPGPIGLAPGIDPHAEALGVLQYLDLGFLIVGPVGAADVPRRFLSDPLRIREASAIVASDEAGAPSAAQVAARIRATPDLAVPVGVALRGDDLAAAARALEDAAAFFVLPPRCADDPAALRAVRDATRRPLLLACAAEWDERSLDARVEAAGEAGVDGVVVLAGERSQLVPGGRATGPFLRERALAAVARIAGRHGDRMPVVGSGGVLSPEDAMAFLDAGAKLVQLYEGLVYAGPGLPARCGHALEGRRVGSPASRPSPAPAPAAPPEDRWLARYARLGRGLIAFTGATLVASGLFALVLAATVNLLPYDVRYLGMSVQDLCALNACKVVHFMAHDRVSFGGSIISTGILYLWLAAVPLRAGERWAFWALVVSGVTGFGSFLTYIGYGYLDVWHGRATLALLPCYLAGLVLTHAGIQRVPRGERRGLFADGARAWLWSPAGMGRACLTFTAIGMLLGGLTIMIVGMTRVFVPTDLEFMGLRAEDLRAINPRLVPLIAHDRAGFGGGLFSTGIVVMSTVWAGLRPGARSLWWALAASGGVGFACAIGIHPIVGYTSFVHLAPAYAGALALVVGLALLYRPLCRWDGPSRKSFPDV